MYLSFEDFFRLVSFPVISNVSYYSYKNINYYNITLLCATPLFTEAEMAVSSRSYVSPSPTVDQFAEVLTQAGTNWFDIGVFLGASDAEIEVIRQNYATNGVVTCLIKLHECLVKKGKPLTWEAIATALRRLDNNRLADSIHSNYILPATIHNATEQDSSTTVPDPQQESAPTTDPQQLTRDQVATLSDTTQQQLVVVEDDRVYAVGSEFLPLFKRYASLSFKIRESFKASNIDVENMQGLIEDLCGLPPLPQNEASVFAVFDRLKKHCSILNFQPLTCVVDVLLSNKKTLRKDLKKLEKAMDVFKRSAKMTAVVNLIESHYESIRDDDKKILKLKVQEFWKTLNLKQFETVIKEILGTKLYTKLSHITVGTGCICVSWIIPPSVEYTKLLPKLSLEFLQIIGVISLHIGDDVIYNVGEEGCQTLEAAMLQATELKNTGAIELLLAVGCSPEVATYNGDHDITNMVNIRERSVDDGSGGGVDHVCVLGHNEHIEAIIDTNRERPECATCRMKEKQIKQLYVQNDTLQQKNKDLCLENETLSSENEAFQVKKGTIYFYNYF